jgi:hypothetical protein
MDSPFSNAEQRLRESCANSNSTLTRMLGHGIDGSVWETSRQSALKACYRTDAYERERDCYRRLFENEVIKLAGFNVPQLLDYDNRLPILEMTVVFPPCILDFGKVHVDSPPDYTREALAEAEQAERELFTEDEWKQVRLVRAALLRHGIHYFEARPSNIMFVRELS